MGLTIVTFNFGFVISHAKRATFQLLTDTLKVIGYNIILHDNTCPLILDRLSCKLLPLRRNSYNYQ